MSTTKPKPTTAWRDLMMWITLLEWRDLPAVELDRLATLFRRLERLARRQAAQRRAAS